MLLLGDYSKVPELVHINKLTSYCNPVNNKCNITGININNKKLEIDSYSIFDTESTSLTIPITDYRIFKKYVFNNTECKIREDRKVACIYDDNTKFPMFNIYINDNMFNIDINKLVSKEDEEYNYTFDIVVDINNFDTWKLGTHVLDNILLSFDLQNIKIGYAQNPNIDVLLTRLDLDEDEEPSKIGYLVSLAVLILIIFYFVKFTLNYRTKPEIFDPYDTNDRDKLESLKKSFNENKYDYNNSPRDNKKEEELKEIKKEDIVEKKEESNTYPKLEPVNT
jgi:hypothetical protein